MSRPLLRPAKNTRHPILRHNPMKVKTVTHIFRLLASRNLFSGLDSRRAVWYSYSRQGNDGDRHGILQLSSSSVPWRGYVVRQRHTSLITMRYAAGQAGRCCAGAVAQPPPEPDLATRACGLLARRSPQAVPNQRRTLPMKNAGKGESQATTTRAGTGRSACDAEADAEKSFQVCDAGILPAVRHGQDGRAKKENADVETASWPPEKSPHVCEAESAGHAKRPTNEGRRPAASGGATTPGHAAHAGTPSSSSRTCEADSQAHGTGPDVREAESAGHTQRPTNEGRRRQASAQSSSGGAKLRPAAAEGRPDVCEANSKPSEGRPDTALLYSVADIAMLAQVSRVFVVRLCLAGELPHWIDVDGGRYWHRRAAIRAVSRCRKEARRRRSTRRIA